MSYDVPPGPPPSEPPSGGPPAGHAETLDSHGGDRRRGPHGRRTTLLASVGAVAVVAAGGAAWAAYSFFSTGAQPAEALPASTIGYASIDLDPSGGQKIEALRTLKKFPAFADSVGLDTDDDVRQWIFEQAQEEAGCADLDYRDDVEPWLGDRFAVAAVDTGGDAPAPVVVLQVSDADAADEGFAKLWECGDSDDGAWTIDGDWLLVGEDQETVDGIAAAAADASLADDDDFRRWTDEVGDSGIVALYAAPGVGALLAEELGGLGGSGEELMPSETLDLLKDFKGAAATLRFDDGGLELEVAADAGSGAQVTEGESAGEVIASLPTGTAAAFAVSFGEGWFGELLDRVSESSGLSSAELIAEARSELGIDLPDDAETVLGDALAVAVDGDFDPESIFAGPDPSGSAGIGVKILGEAEGIEAVLEKIRAAAAGADAGLLESDADADGSAVAVGPNAGYRERLLSEGGLGDSDSFKRVVAHRDQVGAVLYIDFDAGDWLANLAGEDPEVRENLAPLDALGMSSWLDGDTTHAVLKVTSD